MWAVTRNTTNRCALLDRRPRCNWYGTCATAKRMQPGTFVSVFSTSLRISKLFNQSTDEAVNYVKQTVFGVSNGNPILSDDHPVVVAMLATHECAQISLLLLDGTY